MDLYTQMTNPN